VIADAPRGLVLAQDTKWQIQFLTSRKISTAKDITTKVIKGCLDPLHPKNSRFWSIILHEETKHHTNFLIKT
jgi:hypothetical protein